MLDVGTSVALAAAAFVLRVIPPWPKVFTDGRIVFHDTDAWFHLRQVDALLRNFPRVNAWDPYRLAPVGQAVQEAPLLDLLVAAMALVAGGGTATERAMETIAVFVPPIMAAFTVVLAYRLATILFGPREAFVTGLLVAILPGQFLLRSLLGFLDHHVAEVLFLTLTLSLTIRSPEASGGVRAGRTLGAGLSLGCYLLTWSGGLFLVAILAAWATARLLVDHRRRVEPEAPGAVPCILLLGLFTWRAGHPDRSMEPFLPAATVLAAGSVAALEFTRFRLSTMNPDRRIFPLLVFTLLSTVLLVASGMPGIRHGVLAVADRFGTVGQATVGEASPFLWRFGAFSLEPVWTEFNIAALLACAGLFLVLRDIRRDGSQELLLLVVWTAAAMAATALQTRFAIYLVVPVSLLAARAVVVLLRDQFPRVAVLPLALLILVPTSASRALELASRPLGGPGPAWFAALDWLRTRTSDPFESTDVYHSRFRAAEDAPRPEWSVMAWWDYGYWITRIAHRVPVSNPTQSGAREAADFFLAMEESEAGRAMEASGARYVVTNDSLLLYPVVDLQGVFFGMGLWAGYEPRDFVDVFLEPDPSGGWRPARFFFPEYYRSMAVRLQSFGGEGFVPKDSTWVIASRESAVPGGLGEITFARRFHTHEEALAFLAGHPGEGYRVAGRDPFRPCVPLAPLEAFRPVFRFPPQDPGAAWTPPEVAVFEHRSDPR